jgi:flagellar motor switch protein FliN/FliY
MSDKEELIKIFVENWTSVYNTILGRDVVIKVASVDTKSKADAAGAVGDYQSFVSLSYGELPGEIMVIGLKNKLVSIISNMMIGLDSFKDEITADDKDAFVEAVNQMFSACQVPLKEAFDLDMRFKDIAFVESGDPFEPITSSTVQVWDTSMELPDIAEETFVIVAPEKFAAIAADEEEAVEEISLDTGVEKPTVTTSRVFTPSQFEGTNIDMLMDVELPVTVRIGTTEMKLIDIMRLGLGSIIELEKMVDDPVEILANQKLVAKGEVVVCDGNYAVKITEVQSREERIRSLA